MIYEDVELVTTQKKLNLKKVIICVLIGIAIFLLIIFIIFFHLKNNTKISDEQILKKNIPVQHIAKYKEKLKETTDIREQINNIYVSDTKRVFLTFDDGPSKSVTPLILDLLKQENIKATFFVLGSRVNINPDLVKREYEEGHYIANHGYSHVYGEIYQNAQTVLDEYYRTEEAIKNATGNVNYNSYLFRFPGGSVGGKYSQIKEEAKVLLNDNSVAYIDWSSLSGDAEGKNTTEELLSYAIETIGDKNSVVILMHDASDKILTYEMLPSLIAYLRENGYEFKNIYDLI